MTENMKCPFCNNNAEWVENKEIYGTNYGKSYMCYLCRSCDAYVGCHQNTKKPLGTMANKELREWRKKAHANIDPQWKDFGRSRGSVYAELKELFGKEVHIGESDIETCKKIVGYSFIK